MSATAFIRIASLALCLGALVGCADPCAFPVDPERCEAARALRLTPTLPAARGNLYADNDDAARLGFQVFYDARFSADNTLRCATCHEPERDFGDGLSVPAAPASVTRNSPTLFNAARSQWQFWDGRADSLWSQPLIAFEADNEMAYSRLEIAHRLQRSYRAAYEKVFGALPDLADQARFPARGKPGDAAFDAMAPGDKALVNRVVANLGKALEAYMRKIATGPARLDAFLDGDASALDATEQRGLSQFIGSGCTSCHGGPALSDDRFHRVMADNEIGSDDMGRAAGVLALAASEFGLGGEFADDTGTEPLVVEPEPQQGAFKTPSLRNVALSAPYMHDGSRADLDAAIAAHEGTVSPTISAEARAELVRFLGALNGAYPSAPWNNWPEK